MESIIYLSFKIYDMFAWNMNIVHSLLFPMYEGGCGKAVDS